MRASSIIKINLILNNKHRTLKMDVLRLQNWQDPRSSKEYKEFKINKLHYKIGPRPIKAANKTVLEIRISTSIK